MASKKKTKTKRKTKKISGITTANLENITLVEGRQIFLNGSIDEKLSLKVCKELVLLDLVDNISPIIMNINSGGGSVTDGFAIIDTMRTIKSPVATVVTGMAASMAGIISITGTKRLMTHNSFWMGHEMVCGNFDYIAKVNSRVGFYNKLWDLLIEHIKKYTKLSLDDLKLLQAGELWLPANECVAKGLVDLVI